MQTFDAIHVNQPFLHYKNVSKMMCSPVSHILYKPNMLIDHAIQAVVYFYVFLYFFGIPISATAWDYPMEPIVTFPKNYHDPYDYAMHTIAYAFACLCVLLLLILLASFILVSVIFTCDATEWVIQKISRTPT
jgi:hypothetical protein